MRLKGLGPQVDEGTVKVLVLGSFPGKASLEKRQYYGYRYNQFWKVIFSVLGENDPGEYAERIELLKTSGVGLWDVIRACERVGSSDSNIKNVEFNDLKRIEKYSGLKAVFFNGRKAEKEFIKYFGGSGIRTKYLPSTSPLNAGMKLKDKVKIWKEIKEFLN